MTHRAAGSISFFLYQKGMIEKDDMDIYQYGFEIFIDSFLEIIMLLLLGILWRKLPETVAFVGTFAILRRYTGGYHASTKTRCVLLTIAIYAVNIGISGVLWRGKEYWILALAMIGALIIWMSAPVSHTNKKLDKEQKMRCKKISRGISLFYLVGIFILKERLIEIGDIIGITLFQVAILILVQRGCNRYEESVRSSKSSWVKDC